MSCNVLAWNEALNRGHLPRLYGYTPGEIPTGEFCAVLDCKIWAKKVIGINCYFSHFDTGQKFQLTVYFNLSSKGYYINSGNVDFSSCAIGKVYYLIVRLDVKGQPFLKHIVAY